MGKLPKFSFAVALTCLTLQVWADPPLEIPTELLNPAAPSEPQRLTLPEERPAVDQVSYWRTSNSGNEQESANSTIGTTDGQPPEPARLHLPGWLLPEPVQPETELPQEPPGEAVVIGDQQQEVSQAEQTIQLAMARIQRIPSRSAALLVVARELAVEANTIGDFGDVIDQCHRALDAGPDERTGLALAKLGAWAYNRRGELLAATGNEHDAFDDFQEAILLDANCWQAQHNRAITLARYAQHNEALADFSRVVELAPEFAPARYNRGELLSQMQRWDEAVADYDIAMKSMPENAKLHAARGHALAQLGRSTAALEDFNQAIRLDNRFSTAYVGRADLHSCGGSYAQAVADLQHALRLDPRCTSAYRSSAWLLATCPQAQYRNGQQAVEAALRLVQLLGDQDPSVLDTLAVSYAAAGNYPQAIAHEERAIALAERTADKRAYGIRLALFRQGKPYLAKAAP